MAAARAAFGNAAGGGDWIDLSIAIAPCTWPVANRPLKLEHLPEPAEAFGGRRRWNAIWRETGDLMDRIMTVPTASIRAVVIVGRTLRRAPGLGGMG